MNTFISTVAYDDNHDIIVRNKYDSQGRLHCTDGPAVLYPNGNYEWRYKGLLHRYDGPAIFFDGCYEWWINGKKHRIGAPAITHPDGYQEWWTNGIQYYPLNIDSHQSNIYEVLSSKDYQDNLDTSDFQDNLDTSAYDPYDELM